MDLVEYSSKMKGAIPVLPLSLAWFCAICNTIFPGLGKVNRNESMHLRLFYTLLFSRFSYRHLILGHFLPLRWNPTLFAIRQREGAFRFFHNQHNRFRGATVLRPLLFCRLGLVHLVGHDHAEMCK